MPCLPSKINAARAQLQAMDLPALLHRARTAPIEQVQAMHDLFCFEDDADLEPLIPCPCYGPWPKGQSFEAHGCRILPDHEWYLPIDPQDAICRRLFPRPDPWPDPWRTVSGVRSDSMRSDQRLTPRTQIKSENLEGH